jgi:hypothetical protein
MNIIKIYNHNQLNYINKFINNNVSINEKIDKIYNNFNPINFFDAKNQYSIRFFKRNLENNLIYNKIFKNKKKFEDHFTFAKHFEDHYDEMEISSEMMKKYYPDDWHDSLIFYDLNFISYTIIQYLENDCDKLIKMVSKDKMYQINIIYSSKEINIDEINKYIYHIHNILIWLNSYKNKKLIKLDILLCPFKKSFSYKSCDTNKYPYLDWTKNMVDDKISKYNINTGTCIGTHRIALFRIDEMFKVLIHESIHLLELDYNLIRDLNNNLNFFIGRNDYSVLINEAIVEYLAIIFWNYYLVNYNEYINKLDLNKYKTFIHTISREKINSAIMCKKLLNYYNITDMQIFNQYDNGLKQGTNAFSYILIKYILLKNILFIDVNKKNDFINDIKEILSNEINQIANYNYLCKIEPFDTNYSLNLSLYKLV